MRRQYSKLNPGRRLGACLLRAIFQDHPVQIGVRHHAVVLFEIGLARARGSKRSCLPEYCKFFRSVPPKNLAQWPTASSTQNDAHHSTIVPS